LHKFLKVKTAHLINKYFLNRINNNLSFFIKQKVMNLLNNIKIKNLPTILSWFAAHLRERLTTHSKLNIKGQQTILCRKNFQVLSTVKALFKEPRAKIPAAHWAPSRVNMVTKWIISALHTVDSVFTQHMHR
jgi:3-methyladenine DNA glycosylase AlkC